MRQLSAGCLTVNRLTILAGNSRYGVPIINDIFSVLAADDWVEGGPPPNIDPVNPNAFPPGKVVKREPGDAVLAFAAWQSIQPVVEQPGGGRSLFMPINRGSDNPVTRACSPKAFRQAGERGDAKFLGQVVGSLSSLFVPHDYLEGCLNGLIKGQEAKIVKPDIELEPILAKWIGSNHGGVRASAEKLAIMWGDPRGEELLRHIVLDQGNAEDKRIEALKMARRVSPALLKDALYRILYEELDGPQGLVLEAIRLLPDLRGDSNPVSWAVDHWKTFSPIQRTAVAEAILTRPEWSAKLLDAVEDKSISPSTLPMTVARSFARSKDVNVKTRAEKLLGVFRESNDDTKKLIATKRAVCVTGEPDIANGKILFTATCGVCHPFHGGGQQVGPDLIGSGRSNLDALLTNVIDPNQIIGNGYEAITVNTKDNRVISGRMVEDTPSHVKLLSIGGAQTVLPRDQIAKLENTKQSLMPQGFGALPDKEFRDMIWYILAPPEEGPLTKEKRAALSQSIDITTAPPAKPKGTNWRAIDWESISLWNPAWKVSAPDFERTPVKLAEYHGKTNVLMVHPFPDQKTPASFERKMKIEPGKTKLRFSAAADDRGDWRVKVLVNGQGVKEQTVDHEKPRWKEVEIDLAKWVGQEVTIRLESHPTGWAWEFAYWNAVRIE